MAGVLRVWRHSGRLHASEPAGWPEIVPNRQAQMHGMRAAYCPEPACSMGSGKKLIVLCPTVAWGLTRSCPNNDGCLSTAAADSHLAQPATRLCAGKVSSGDMKQACTETAALPHQQVLYAGLLLSNSPICHLMPFSNGLICHLM